MPTLDWNVIEWGQRYKWPEAGDEWSRMWGGSEAQWFGSLYPRLHRLLPTTRILEIAPGHGRWSKFLIPQCSRYLGIDLNESCIEVCKSWFSGSSHARFAANDGMSLRLAEDRLYDFVFSFNSLVHAEIEVLRSYIPQIIQKLTPRGVAFIHHSNLANAQLRHGQPVHGRASSVSALGVAEIITGNAGKVVLQEVISWVDTGLIDCMTIFGRREAFGRLPTTVVENPFFLHEAALISKYQAPYSRLSSGAGLPLNIGEP